MTSDRRPPRPGRFGGALPLVARLSAFTAAPVLSLLASLAVMPVIPRIVGDSGWGTVQSAIIVGTGGATLILWNWNVIGPAAIAMAPTPHAQRELYARSVRMRILTAAIVTPLAALLAWTVSAPGFGALAVTLTSITAVVTGLSPTWFAIGSGRPGLMLRYEVAPKLVAAAVSSPLMILTNSVWPYIGVLAITSAVGLALAHRIVMAGDRVSRGSLSEVVADVGRNWVTAAIGVSVMLYASAPAPIASYFLPAAEASRLSSADSAYRVGLVTVMALGNTLQGWTLTRGGDPLRRQWLAFGAQGLLGVIGGLALGVLTPWATGLVFDIAATPVVAWAYAVAFLFLSASTPLTRNILMAINPMAILRATLASLVVGMSLMFWAGASGHAGGIVAGMAAGEALLFLALLRPAWRALARVPAMVGGAQVPDAADRPDPSTPEVTP